MRRIIGVLVGAAGVLAAATTITAIGSAATSTTVCAPVPNPSGTGYWTPFGTGAWGPSGLLTTSRARAGQPYGVTCGGANVYGNALPTTDPHQVTALSFDFSPNQTGPSGSSPRLVVCFTENCSSNGNVSPSAWTANTWTHFNGLANGSWESVGGTCGARSGLSFSAMAACHPGEVISQVAIVNDSGTTYSAGEQVLLNNLRFNNVFAQARAPGPPQAGKNVNVRPVSGLVRVKLPGSKRFTRLRGLERIPLGTVVDAIHGVVTVLAAKTRHGQIVKGQAWGGVFRITQQRVAVNLLTVLKLAGRSLTGCGKRAADEAKWRPRHHSFWMRDPGYFMTVGKFASATDHGTTTWLTGNSCKGTLIKVARGSVTVSDFPHHHVFTLRARHSFLAHPGTGG